MFAVPGAMQFAGSFWTAAVLESVPDALSAPPSPPAGVVPDPESELEEQAKTLEDACHRKGVAALALSAAVGDADDLSGWVLFRPEELVANGGPEHNHFRGRTAVLR